MIKHPVVKNLPQLLKFVNIPGESFLNVRCLRSYSWSQGAHP